MTQPNDKQQVLRVPSIDPAVSVQAALLARAVLNATAFASTDPDDPPSLRSVGLTLVAEGLLQVTSGDGATAFYQPLGTGEASVDLAVRVDQADAHLMALAIGAALRSASEADQVSARLRVLELHDETLLRLDVGRRRLDVTTLPSNTGDLGVARLVAKHAMTGEFAPYVAHLNAKLLARLAKGVTAAAFPLGAVLSLATGRLVSEFADMHGLIEHLCGGPVWTHELASVADACTAEVLRQRPDLTGVPVPIVQSEAEAQEYVAQQAAEHGDVVWLVGGLAAVRGKSPLETLADIAGDRPIIPIAADEEPLQ